MPKVQRSESSAVKLRWLQHVSPEILERGEKAIARCERLCAEAGAMVVRARAIDREDKKMRRG